MYSYNHDAFLSPFRGESGHWRKFLPWYPCPLIMILLVAAFLGLLVTLLTAVRPVHVAVEDASLARLALADRNATATALAYDVSLAVAVHNPNGASIAKLGTVDADLRFAGTRIAGVRMQGQGSSREIQAGKTDVYHVAAAGESAQLGSDEVAEFLKESAAGGVFRLELKLSGEVRYPPHTRVHRLEATCPLELPLSSPALTKKVKCV